MKTVPKAPRVLRSSWLLSAVYARGTLTLAKEDGELMVFSGVPPWKMGLLCAAKSPGRFFGRQIRKRYPYKRVILPKRQELSSRELCILLRASLAAHGRGKVRT